MPRHGKKKKGGAPKAAPESDDVLAGRRRHVMDDMAAFEQQQFDSATQDDDSDALACKIAENEQYGRHLVATATIEAGDVIFKEKAFVAASWHEFHCIECMAPHKPAKCERVRERYSKAFRDNITTIEEIMSDMPGIDEIDRARALIRVLRMCDVDEADVAASEPLQLFLSLDQGRQPPSYEKCLTSIRALRTRHVIATSGVFPPGLTDEDIARVLAILNQCSHELEDVGGGGLFLYASLIPHSCVPNCNYVTEKDRIYLIAMRPIEAGEPLTLDFSPAFYKPTVERQAALLRSHGISCHCPGCTVLPDRCRSFRCPRAVRHCHGLPEPAGSSLSATVAPTAPCVSGTVSPVGRGEAPGDWACLKCGYHLTDVEINICLDAEQRHPAPPDQDDEVDDDNELSGAAGDSDNDSGEDSDGIPSVRSPKRVGKPAADKSHGSAMSKLQQMRKGAMREGDSDDDEEEEVRYDADGLAFRPRTLDDIDVIIGENIMTDAHYSVFHSLLNLGHELARLASQSATAASTQKAAKKGKKANKKAARKAAAAADAARERKRLCRQAEGVWLRVINAAEVAIPGPHPDKCNFLDYLAQVRVVGKCVPAAQQAWQFAAEMSAVVNGRDTRTTGQLRRLAKNPPATVEKMMVFYNNVGNAMDAIQFSEDRESAALMVKLMDSTLEEVQAHQQATAEEADDDDGDDDNDNDGDNDEDEDDDDGNDAVAFFGLKSKKTAAETTPSLFANQLNTLAGAASAFTAGRSAAPVPASGMTWGAGGGVGVFGAPAPKPHVEEQDDDDEEEERTQQQQPAASNKFNFAKFALPTQKDGDAPRNPFAAFKRP